MDAGCKCRSVSKTTLMTEAAGAMTDTEDNPRAERGWRPVAWLRSHVGNALSGGLGRLIRLPQRVDAPTDIVSARCP
jgi:hypothetical protein